MTDAEIVKVLAERFDSPTSQAWDFLSDRNALASVIGKMTGEQKKRFDQRMWELYMIQRYEQKILTKSLFYLTCDPRVVAECVAKAIQKGKA